MSSQTAKQMLSTDWSYITLLDFVNLIILLIEKCTQMQFATLTTLPVVWAFSLLRIFFWSEMDLIALKDGLNITQSVDSETAAVYRLVAHYAPWEV